MPTQAMRDFSRGVLKIGTAIVGSVVVLAIIAGLIEWARDTYQKQQARPFEEVRKWEKDLTEPLQLKVNGRSKLVDGQMYAEFDFDGYPDYLASPANRSNDAAGFSIGFVDSDGFELQTRFVKLREAATMYGAGNKKSGLRYAFNEYVPIETYRRFAGIRIGWRVKTTPRVEEALPPKPTEDAVPDHCAPGLSKAERLKRLAKHGTVREVGLNSFAVDEREITFLSGGSELLGCK